MKKTVSLLLIMIFLTSMTCGCSLNNIGSDKIDNEIIVFAASSLLEPFNDIQTKFNEKYPDVSVIYNFDSSGTLKKQIEAGAECNIFVSANKKCIDELTGSEIFSQKDLIQNEVVLVKSDIYDGKVLSFDEAINGMLNQEITLAVGNSNVPVGDYTMSIFENYGVRFQDLIDCQNVTFCSSAKEVVAQVNEGSVDLAVVYLTDARINELEIIDTADIEVCGEVLYPCALLGDDIKESANAELFYNFLSSDISNKIFEKYGFSLVK